MLIVALADLVQPTHLTPMGRRLRTLRAFAGERFAEGAGHFGDADIDAHGVQDGMDDGGGAHVGFWVGGEFLVQLVPGGAAEGGAVLAVADGEIQRLADDGAPGVGRGARGLGPRARQCPDRSAMAPHAI